MSINKTIIPARMHAAVISRLNGKTAATAKPVYSSQDPYGPNGGTFIRNSNCWINGITNISCFSPAQLSGANWRVTAGTLITPKHVLFARHFIPAIISGGTPLIFVDENNNVVRRKLIQITSAGHTDISVGLLESDVSPNIKIAKVLPKNYSDFIDFYSVPVVYGVGLDQQEKALVFSLSQISTSFNVNVGENIPAPYRDFSEGLIAGDSGNPAFLIVNNELVVMTTWWTGGAYGGGGPFVSNTQNYDSINQLINDLSPSAGYSLTDVDLTAAATERQLYFNETVDSNWTTLGNWFQASNFTTPAGTLPSVFDTPILPWSKSVHRVIGGSGVLSGF